MNLDTQSNARNLFSAFQYKNKFQFNPSVGLHTKLKLYSANSPCRQKPFAECFAFLLMPFVALCIQPEIQPFVSKLPRLISCLSAHGSLVRQIESYLKYGSCYDFDNKRIYNDGYHEMREALDIKPYDFIQDDSFFEEGMDDVFLLLDNNEIVGTVALKIDEIDDLIVNRKYQGKGYGIQILLWAIKNIRTQKPILHVAGWNEKAIVLYKNVGFEIIETIEI